VNRLKVQGGSEKCSFSRFLQPPIWGSPPSVKNRTLSLLPRERRDRLFFPNPAKRSNWGSAHETEIYARLAELASAFPCGIHGNAASRQSAGIWAPSRTSRSRRTIIWGYDLPDSNNPLSRLIPTINSGEASSMSTVHSR
jgi:hypothetical protein